MRQVQAVETIRIDCSNVLNSLFLAMRLGLVNLLVLKRARFNKSLNICN